MIFRNRYHYFAMPLGMLSLKTVKTFHLAINCISSCGSYSKAEICLGDAKSKRPDSPETFEKKPHMLLRKFQNPFVFIPAQNKMCLNRSEGISQGMEMPTCARPET